MKVRICWFDAMRSDMDNRMVRIMITNKVLLRPYLSDTAPIMNDPRALLIENTAEMNPMMVTLSVKEISM